MPAPSIQEVFAAHRDSLMALPGVVGAAIGHCGDAPCIRVFVSGPVAMDAGKVPDRVDGFAVRVEVSGEFRPR